MTIIRCAALVLACVVGASSAAESQWRITSADGASSLSVGLLAQPQMEVVTAPEGADAATNFLIRRTRLIFGGKVGDRVSFFVETDAPNIGKADSAGRKDTASMFLQDVVLTYAVAGSINIDAGLAIVPVSRHSTQSAANLLGVDYAPFAFTHSDPTGSRVGRDYGVQARGYLADNHFEFRAGLFSGARGAGATAPLRYALRAVWYPFEAETGIFYAGTSLGTRRVVSVGASLDRQDDYMANSVDVYVDHPVGEGNQSVTAQVNYTRYDGNTTFTTLPEQGVWFVEAGVFDKRTKLGPFLQWTTKDYRANVLVDESKLMGGIAYWANGHRFNVKLGIGRLSREGEDSRTQVVVQGQLFMF